MNIVERASQFVQTLNELARRKKEGGKQCPQCGSCHTIRYGTYYRHPWSEEGRISVQVQRHRCRECGRTYGEQTIWLAPRSWYTCQ